MGSATSPGIGLGRLPMSIAEGARVYRLLRLRFATIEAFLAAVRGQAGTRAASETLGFDPGQLGRLVERAEQLLEGRSGADSGAG